VGIFIAIYVFALVVYLSNKRAITAVDTIPARYLCLSLLRDGDLDLREYKPIKEKLGLSATIEHNEHLLSLYPVGCPFLGAIYYALGMNAGLQAQEEGMIWLEKWAAANIGALLVAAFWFLLRKTRARFPVRLIVWLVFSFGSTNWVPCSQGLWQHGAAELFIVLALLAWPVNKGKHDDIRFVLTGLCLGLSVMMRPTFAILGPVWLASLFGGKRRFIPHFLGGLFLGLLPFFYYHLTYFGGVLGAGYFGQMKSFSAFRPLYFLAGHLFSPSRGLLIFSPFFLLVPVSLLPKLRSCRPPVYQTALWGFSCLAIVGVILLFRTWWAGWGYGPRFWSDTLPFLCLLSIPAVEWSWKRNRRKVVIGLLVLYSIAVQALGAWRYDCGWDEAVDVDRHPEKCWDVSDNAIFFCITGGTSHTGPVGPVESYTIKETILDMGKPENQHFLRSGFYIQEDWGAWSRGHYPAIILFHAPRKEDGRIFLSVIGYSSEISPKRLKFYINGHYLSQYELKKNARKKWEAENIALYVPSKYLTGQIEKLKITCSEGNYVGPGFSSFLGFGLSRFGWYSLETLRKFQKPH
jgi:hypothetical protein